LRTETDKKHTLKIWRIKKRRQITVETTQQFVVSRPEAVVVTWCEACAENVSMVTSEVAAVIVAVKPREIYRSVEGGRLHFAESSEGLLLICVKSLSEMDSKRRPLELPPS
jgi:hypothetical protein